MGPEGQPATELWERSLKPTVSKFSAKARVYSVQAWITCGQRRGTTTAAATATQRTARTRRLPWRFKPLWFMAYPLFSGS